MSLKCWTFDAERNLTDESSMIREKTHKGMIIFGRFAIY